MNDVADEGATIVALSGVIDVRSIGGAYEELRTAFARGGAVVLDLAGVTELDVTLVQLIESARRTAAQSGQEFRLAGAEILQEVLERGGFPAAEPFWQGVAA